MTNPMIAPLISPPQGAEWLVILLIVIIIFGAAKLPELARGTGQALRIFKAETKGLIDNDEDDDVTPAKKETKSQLPTAREDLPTTSDTQTDKHNG